MADYVVGSTAVGKLVLALNAQPNGKGGRALCPAHNDHRPSLDIDEGKDGKVLVICRAGCSQEAVINRLIELGIWPGNGYDANEAQRIRGALSMYDAASEKMPGPALKYFKRRGLKSKAFPGVRWSTVNHSLIFRTGSTGTQQIYLDKDGQKTGDPPKRSHGPMGPGMVLEREGAEITYITEGPEDAWTCFEAEPEASVVAACGQGRLAKAAAAAKSEKVVLVLDSNTDTLLIGAALAAVPHAQIVRMARRITSLAVEAEVMEAARAEGGELDLDAYVALTNALGRALGRLGLGRKARDVTPRLKDIIEGRAG